MPNSLNGSIATNTSALDEMLQSLNQMLEKQKEINRTPINPKVDDQEIKRINDEIRGLYDKIEKGPKNSSDFLNTPMIQRSINDAKKQMDGLFNRIQKRADDLDYVDTKSFIKNYQILEKYSKQFGIDLVSNYKKVFDEMINGDIITTFGRRTMSDLVKHSLVDRTAFNQMRNDLEQETSRIVENNINDQKTIKQVYDIQSQSLKEQRAAIRENNQTFVESEKQKRQEILETQKLMAKTLKEMMNGIMPSEDSEAISVDYEKYALFQKQIGDVLQTMSELGIETREYEAVLDSLSKKIYIPQDILNNIKKGAASSEELENAKKRMTELEDEVKRLNSVIDEGVAQAQYDAVVQDLEKARQEIINLKSEVDDLNTELRYSVNYFSYESATSRVGELQEKVEELEKELKQLRSTNVNHLVDDQEIASTTRGLTSVEEEIDEINKDTTGISSSTEKGFDTSSIQSFIDILQKLEQYLNQIADTLGTVDDKSGFGNIISSVSILLTKLDEMYEKIGTGVYNFDMRVGAGYGTAGDKILSDERSELKSQYKKIVERFGGETNLFTELANVLSLDGKAVSIDDLVGTYGEQSLNKLDSDKAAVNRLHSFFELLSQYKELAINNIKEINDELKTQVEDTQLNNRFVGEVNRFRNFTNAEYAKRRRETQKKNKEFFEDSLFKEIMDRETYQDEVDSNVTKFNLKHDYNVKEKTKAAERNNIINNLEQRIEENERRLQELEGLSQYDKYSTSDVDERIAEANTAERDSLIKLQESSQNNLNDIIEQLGKIETLLSEIREKPLFENALDKFKQDLDEVSQSIRDIVNNLSEINIVPKGDVNIATDSIKEETSAIKEKGEAAEKTAVSKDVLSNANANLSNKSEATTESVKEETEAIQEKEEALKNLSAIESTVGSDKKNVVGTTWNQKIDADGNISDISRSFKTREETGRTVEYTQRGDEITIKERTDYNKAIKQTADAFVEQARAEHDLSIEQEKTHPDIQIVNALTDQIADCTRRINEATSAAAEFDREMEQWHNDPKTGSKFEQYSDFTTRYQQEAASRLAKEEKRYSEYISKRNTKLQSQLSSNLFTVQYEIENGKHTDQFIQDLRDIQTRLESIQQIHPNNITEQDVEQARNLNSELKQLSKNGQLTANKRANENSIVKNLSQINDILSKNTKSSFKRTDVYRDLVNLQNQFQSFDTSRPQSELNALTTSLLNAKARFNELGNMVKGKNFFETFVERLRGVNAQLIAQYLSWQDLIRYARTAITTIVDLDTALVDLRKTTTMNNTELNSFYKSSNQIAKSLGITTQEVITQAAAWSRLGFSTKDQVETMSKLSSQFAAISPGMDVEQATDGLVSTMKAFDVEYTDVLDGIMSKINKIGNTAATSNAEIVDMLQRSSAAMAEANNTLDETIALETAAVEITRSAETTGTAFKTLAMRIRGYDEEGEVLEDYEELKGKIADLTKTAKTPGGISLFTDETKTEFKSTYQLLSDIHEIYNDLTDKQQAGLLEAIAGERFARNYRNIVYRTHLIARSA